MDQQGFTTARYPIKSIIQVRASTPVLLFYSLIFTMGIIPAALMTLWARFLTARWFAPPEPAT